MKTIETFLASVLLHLLVLKANTVQLVRLTRQFFNAEERGSYSHKERRECKITSALLCVPGALTTFSLLAEPYCVKSGDAVR